MLDVDPKLFTDVADVLGIENPVIVEKDYYAVKLLKELNSLTFDNYELVFAGGTCLAKAYKNTYRMSEDIDLKLVPSKSMSNVSRNIKRQKRREVQEIVFSSLKSSLFTIKESKKQNEGQYQQFLVEYPLSHPQIQALRPHLQLELTESILLQPAINRPISSLYAEIAKLEPEISSLPCATIESIASEKFVALLRRIASFHRDNTKENDEALIRHVYDLHLMRELLPDTDSIKKLVSKVIETDVQQFGNQSKLFQNNPTEELKNGLNILINNPLYKTRYDRFIGPLVYHPNPADWSEVISTISGFAKSWL
jgi:predicted nucleotidyltransferase component of viral defense system